MNAFLGSIIRHGLTAAGGAGFAVSDDLVMQVANAIIFLIGLGASLYKSRKSLT